MSPACFSCHRPAARFDRQIDQWVCEGHHDCSMSMRPQQLARLLETEHRCEICHTKQASVFFDRQLVCAGCGWSLERKLVKRG